MVLPEWREDADGQLKAYIGDTEAAWCPQPGSQAAFLACPLWECLYEGTRGPGKTDGLIMDFGQHVDQGFGAEWRGILFRQTYPQLQDVIAKTKKWLPRIFPGAQFNESTKTWKFRGGEELFLRHMLRPDDYWNYHGHAYPWIGFEELTTWPTDECYTSMMSCSRSTVRGMPRKVRATTNPYGTGHNWVKLRFGLTNLPEGQVVHPIVKGDKHPDTGEIMPDRVAIRGHLSENKILLHADPDYPARIVAAARSPAMAKAWIDGDWNIVAGGMFDDVFYVHQASIVKRPFKIPHTWRLDRSFDWGSSHPFSVGWWAQSDGSDYLDHEGKSRPSVKGDLFRVGEWYGARKGRPNEGLRMSTADIAKGIREREMAMFPDRWQRIKAGPADSSIFDDNTDGPSIAEIFAEDIRLDDGQLVRGIDWEKADKRPGSRVLGWEVMREKFINTSPNNPGIPREDPGLFIFDTCTEFLRLVPVLPRDEKKMDDVDTESEDHIGDECRYRVRYEPPIVGSGRASGMF